MKRVDSVGSSTLPPQTQGVTGVHLNTSLSNTRPALTGASARAGPTVKVIYNHIHYHKHKYLDS